MEMSPADRFQTMEESKQAVLGGGLWGMGLGLRLPE
jgi:hypothetical protein